MLHYPTTMMKSILHSARHSLLALSLGCLSAVSCANKPASANNNPTDSKMSVGQLISEKQFNELFPQRNALYSYAAFVKAARELGLIKIKVIRRAVSVYQLTRTNRSTGKSTVVRQDPDWNEDWAKQKPDSTYYIDFGQFCAEKDAKTNKKELAAFFAHIAHETRNGQNGTYTDGLMLTHERNTSLPYVAENDEYPPVPGQKYYGRGPMQLSYNGNYGYAADCILGNAHILLNNPSLVETDGVLAFKTAIYFWMTPQTHKPSAHDVMTGKWQPSSADKAKGRVPGFGMTINIINGELECNHGDNVPSMQERIAYYQHFLSKMWLSDPNCACSCGSMQPYK